EAVHAVFPESQSGGAQVVAALRPKQRWLHLSSTDEAKKYTTLATLPAALNEPSLAGNPPSEFTAVYTNNGLAISGSGAPWLLAGAAKESYAQSLATLEELKLKPLRVSPATLSAAGAVASALKVKGGGPVLLLEFGEVSAHLLLIGSDGVQAVRATAVTMDKVAEAVQAELGLKFKGSAGKLFFNEFYDFSETGPKIAARIAQELSADVGALGHAPSAFACAGLPAKQSWFANNLATALKLAPLGPDLKAWSSQAGFAFASPEIESNASPAWLGFLHLIGSYQSATPEKSAWQPDWTRKAPAPAAMPAAPAAKPATPPPAPMARPITPAPTAKPSTPTPPARPAIPPAPGARPFTPTPPSGVKPTTPFTPAKPGTPVPPARPAAPTPTKPITPAPAAKPTALAPAKPAAPIKPLAPAAQVLHGAPPAAAKPGAPAPAKPPAPARPPMAPIPPGTATKPSFFKSPAGYITIAAAVIVLGVVGYSYYSNQEKAVALAHEKAEAEHRASEEAEKLRIQKQQADEALKKAQEEAAAKLKAAEDARKQAEEKARAETAAHLAAARGRINLVTEPAGATVRVGNLPPRTSPALFDEMKLGHYPVTISLSGYDEMKLDLEVKENQTADPGIIKLTSQIGSLQLTTVPAGATYNVRSAAERFQVTAGPQKLNTTPVFNDNWAGGDRTKQNPPNSLAWFCSSVPNSVTVSSGSLTLMGGDASRHIVAYFPRQQLSTGDSLTLTYKFTLAGPLQQIGNASSTSFKVGLFDSNGSFIYNADDQQSGNPVAYVGYAVGTGFAAPGDNSSNAFNIRKRIPVSGNLIVSNSGVYRTLPSKNPGKQRFQPDTTYTGTITIESISENEIRITSSYTGGDLSDYMVSSVDHSGEESKSVVSSFDTIAFALPASSGTTAARAVTLTDVRLTYSTPGGGMSGTTPAMLNNVHAGEYIVTFSREGFASHSENVTVGRGTTARASWQFPNGQIVITSTPQGAAVMRSGLRIGSTPLTLKDVPPGEVDYTLALPNYDEATVSGTVEGGQTLTLNSTLLSVDRITKVTDL
ncbi:MAG: PEGA domain-containing protein, partial [Verrucomicrobiota bacterium]|nr:PEGA domain-containing protein [Verrucomicrobiota bacterium]